MLVQGRVVVRAGFNSFYSCSKQAIIRPTGNIEQELNIQGKDRISLLLLYTEYAKTSINETFANIGSNCKGVIVCSCVRSHRLHNGREDHEIRLFISSPARISRRGMSFLHL